MMEFKTIDDVLNFAIKDEQRASDLYADLASKSRNREIQKVFDQFSKEELGHKKKLETIRDQGKVAVTLKKVQDLQIGDYLVEVSTSRVDLSYQEALIVAMKEEKAAFRLYSDLAAKTDHADLKDTFLSLAQEEAKHKLRFEIEYDDYILKEN
jgi:rubrerythrin